MSRPQKIHKPIKGTFNNILGVVAIGTGRGKNAAKKLASEVVKASDHTPKKP
jgi:hypothetical protein